MLSKLNLLIVNGQQMGNNLTICILRDVPKGLRGTLARLQVSKNLHYVDFEFISYLPQSSYRDPIMLGIESIQVAFDCGKPCLE
ncbi:hypothetical protein PRIPAC_86716 [Pristionchus pacificus]|uniref:Uncharacterized protein n=1 Tax=Pristionchus pacificus TaxID=54126 RepID=A0A2A6BSN0_PRIPA|nr:hypothetical protein PRIPAC_86716 [Pristionchus pacificus]|eukprot:PDM68771.1 hypothetical protein PRIPAC_47073 [Pristionchus pacificus]